MQNLLSEALKGVRVLDFTRLYPGPLRTLMLADLGADVIKVEGPNGELGRSMPPAFLQLNRNKRSLTLDLQKETAREVVRKLLKRCDILVESFRPGVMRRFGLDFENLREIYPGLVYCSITGYGQTGPDAHRPGHDLNYISLAGGMSSGEDPEKGCVIPRVQIADTIGGFQAITAILAALIQRWRTGSGQFLDISLLDGAYLAMILPASSALAGEDPDSEHNLSGKLACYNVYRTADHRYLAIALLEPKFWKLFCTQMELPQLADFQFQENQTELMEIISAKIVSRPLKHWLDAFQFEDICVTPVHTVQEALREDLIRQRQLFMPVDYPFGTLLQIKTPFVESNSMNEAPDLGEHNHQILEEAGYSREEIQEFIRHKLI